MTGFTHILPKSARIQDCSYIPPPVTYYYVPLTTATSCVVANNDILLLELVFHGMAANNLMVSIVAIVV